MKPPGIALILFLCLFYAAPAAAAVEDRVLAVVNDEVFTLSDFRKYLRLRDTQYSDGAIDDRMLREFISERLMIQEAKKKNITASIEEVDEQVKGFLEVNRITAEMMVKDLADHGMTMEEYRVLLGESIIRTKLTAKEVDSKVIVTDDDRLRFYRDNMHLFTVKPERMLLNAVCFGLDPASSAEEIMARKLKALKAMEEIRSGMAFEDAVRIYSDGGMTDQAGRLGEFGKGELVPSLDRAASSLKEGDVSDPVWTGDGGYIIRLEKRSAAIYKTFEEVREGLDAQAFDYVRNAVLSGWLRRLWDDSSITIY